jgi:hypothetical protein
MAMDVKRGQEFYEQNFELQVKVIATKIIFHLRYNWQFHSHDVQMPLLLIGVYLLTQQYAGLQEYQAISLNHWSKTPIDAT